MNEPRTYIAIDLKSFYASVECVERGLAPLNTNLVVADESRTEKIICLAVSPSLKAYGIGGRARLFEVVQRMNEVNGERRRAMDFRPFTGKYYSDKEIKEHPDWDIDYNQEWQGVFTLCFLPCHSFVVSLQKTIY